MREKREKRGRERLKEKEGYEERRERERERGRVDFGQREWIEGKERNREMGDCREKKVK